MVTPHITITLSENATFTGFAAADNVPVGLVRFGEGGTYIAVASTDVEALLALADAAQEAARQLRLVQLRAEARRAVA